MSKPQEKRRYTFRKIRVMLLGREIIPVRSFIAGGYVRAGRLVAVDSDGKVSEAQGQDGDPVPKELRYDDTDVRVTQSVATFTIDRKVAMEMGLIKKHEAPWAWCGPDNGRFLCDANGQVILSAEVFDDSDEPTPHGIVASDIGIFEQIRLLPEMEALLRQQAARIDECPWCASLLWKQRPHEDDCPLSTVLAALDTARKEG